MHGHTPGKLGRKFVKKKRKKRNDRPWHHEFNKSIFKVMTQQWHVQSEKKEVTIDLYWSTGQYAYNAQFHQQAI